jgi:hypothetical protein
MNTQKLLKHIQQAFNDVERTNAETVWKEISTYMLPYQDGAYSTNQKTLGKGVNPLVFDSTAILAARDLAAALHSSITNPSMKWSHIKYKKEELNNNMEAVGWLDDVNSKIHSYISESNFDSEIGKCYKAFVAHGNFVITHEPLIENDAFTGFKFSALPIGSVAFCENADKKIDKLYRKISMTVSQIYDLFPKTCGEEILNKLEHNPLERYVVYHAIYNKDKYSKGLASEKDRPISECFILEKNGLLLAENGHYEMPVYVVRWDSLPNEVYGTGAGHVALPDVKTLNTMQGDNLSSSAKAIRPPILSTIGNLLSEPDLTPGAINTVVSLDGFKELTTNARFDVAQAEMDHLRNSIKSAFFIDKLMLPPRTETGEMTAYEVSQRLEQMQQILAPTLSRLNSEFLAPFIVRCFRMLVRNGVVTIPKSFGKEFDDLDVSFINPLARSQQLSELRNVQTFVNETANMAQISPDILDTINFDEVVNYSAKIRNIPEGILRADKDVKAIRDQKQQQQQQQMALAAAEPLSNAAKNISQAGGME